MTFWLSTTSADACFRHTCDSSVYPRWGSDSPLLLLSPLPPCVDDRVQQIRWWSASQRCCCIKATCWYLAALCWFSGTRYILNILLFWINYFWLKIEKNDLKLQLTVILVVCCYWFFHQLNCWNQKSEKSQNACMSPLNRKGHL